MSKGGADAARSARYAGRVLRTELDPVAVAILTRIATGPATSAELAHDLGLEAEAVRGGLGRLSRAGQAVRQGTRRRRGRHENLWSADLSAFLGTVELIDQPSGLVRESRLALLRTMYREGAASIEAGVFHSRPESSATRVPVPIDPGALRDAIDIHRRLLSAMIEEAERAGARLVERAEVPILASAFILLFESPLDDSPPQLPAEVARATRRVSGDKVDTVLGLTDPPLISIVDRLSFAPATVADLAARLELPAAKVRYELDRLLADGLVGVVERRRSRGTSERVFILDGRAQLLLPGDFADHQGGAKTALGIWTFRRTIREALDALREADRRTAERIVAARLPMAVDVEGLAAMATLIEVAVEELFVVCDRSHEKRDAADPTDPRLAYSGIFLFERAPTGRGKD